MKKRVNRQNRKKSNSIKTKKISGNRKMDHYSVFSNFGLVSLIASLFFLSPNITGQVTGVGNVTFNFLGVILLLVGIVGLVLGNFKRK